MKRLINRICIALCAVLTWAGCSEDGTSFEGRDAHIVAFSLTADGAKYQGTIAENTIVVTVPSNVSLSKATAEYTLCENAAIMPDPGAISNWNEEQIFRVQARNEGYTSYKYTVRREAVANGGDVLLASQTDVDALAQKGIGRIEGNLIIGSSVGAGADPVMDLSGLSSLTEVGFNVVINNGFKGTTLSGLQNLKKIGGLYIGTEPEKGNPGGQMTVELPGLQQASNIVIHCDSVTSVLLPKLTSVGKIYVNSVGMRDICLLSLAGCSGDFTVKGMNGGGAETASNLRLEKLELPVLKKVDGNFLLENFWKITTLDISALEQVEGDFQIRYIREIKAISLPQLNRVAGAFNILANDGMTDFSAPKLTSARSLNVASVNSYSINLKSIDMHSLETVEGDFTIQYFGAAAMEFPKLSAVGGALKFSDMQFVESVSVPLLTKCASVSLQNNPMLKMFDASAVTGLNTITLSGCMSLVRFGAPREISGDISLNGRNKVCKFTEFEGLEVIGGKLTVASFNNTEITMQGVRRIGSYVQSSGTNLTTLTLADVETIGDVTLSGMAKLARLSAPKLTRTANLSIKGLFLLETIDMPLLTTVNGTLTFYGGSYASQAAQSKTAHLDGFAALTSATKVDVRYAGSLADFSGLKGVIAGMAPADWNVQNCKYNPAYQDMADGKYTNQ